VSIFVMSAVIVPAGWWLCHFEMPRRRILCHGPNLFITWTRCSSTLWDWLYPTKSREFWDVEDGWWRPTVHRECFCNDSASNLSNQCNDNGENGVVTKSEWMTAMLKRVLI
jgi:hypothetical protein